MRFFATASAGTEDLLADELRALGLRGVRNGRGGVWFAGDTRRTACAPASGRASPCGCCCRSPSFPAVDAEALYARAREVRWEEHLDPTRTFAVEAVGRTEALGHTHFTALKVKDAVVDALRERCGARPNVDVDDPDVRIVAHLARGRASLSLDLAGEPLFKRGWRLAQTEATLKETLAAAILRACGYDGTRPLIDPMCGSGTLADRGRADRPEPRARVFIGKFGIERWASFDESCAPSCAGCATRPAGACGAAPLRSSPVTATPTRSGRRRSMSSGQACRSRCEQADARELTPLDPPGFVVVNPPWGRRLDGGGRRQLKTFFWQLGQAWRGLTATGSRCWPAGRVRKRVRHAPGVAPPALERPGALHAAALRPRLTTGGGPDVLPPHRLERRAEPLSPRSLEERRAIGKPAARSHRDQPDEGRPADAGGGDPRGPGRRPLLRYEPTPFGDAAAREAVSAYHGGAVPPEHVVLTASTSEAYALLFKLLGDPGDRVLVPGAELPALRLPRGAGEIWRPCPTPRLGGGRLAHRP